LLRDLAKRAVLISLRLTTQLTHSLKIKVGVDLGRDRAHD